jgi:isopentenyl diphosphate isomerase/L-lactate dehydrogenase-like FMN-dependent dehydrogenase
MRESNATCRRQFLRLLAGSPLLAVGGLPAGPWTRFPGLEVSAAAQTGGAADPSGSVIASAADAASLFDFEATCREKLSSAHFQYIAQSSENGAGVRRNRGGFEKFAIRNRRLVDTHKLDMSVQLFGTAWTTPIVLSPCSSLKAFHPEGELAVARAARANGHLQIVSTFAGAAVEEVVAARGGPIWFQLYPTDDFNVTRALLKRAQAAGCPAVAVTVDSAAPGPWMPFRQRMNSAKDGARNCGECHGGGFADFVKRKGNFNGLDISNVTVGSPPTMSWDLVKRIKDATTMKVLLKGILTREDAQLTVEHGVDGVIVSNHGGRTSPGSRSTIEALPEVVDGAAGKIPVLVDSGFRRGTDVFKALALGAKAVCIGRPYCWGLGAFGQAGVEAVLAIVTGELANVMHQAGTPSIQRITRDLVVAV